MDTAWDIEAVKRRKLHERYILGILLSILIGVLTVKWSEVPKLTEYLGFALTLASLLLAIIAIGYAIYSNHGLETNLGSLVATVADVKVIASSLSASSTLLSTDMQVLAETTGGIGQRISEIAENTKNQEQRKQMAEMPDVAVHDSKAEIAKPENARTYDLKLFSATSSINGRTLLFLLTIAFLNKKALNLRDLFTEVGKPEDYYWGFVVACACAKLFEGDTTLKALVVTSFPGADRKYAEQLIQMNQKTVVSYKSERSTARLEAEYGKIRSYLNKNGFDDYGLLSKFEIPPDGEEPSL
jgi:hypothetical protein